MTLDHHITWNCMLHGNAWFCIKRVDGCLILDRSVGMYVDSIAVSLFTLYNNVTL